MVHFIRCLEAEDAIPFGNDKQMWDEPPRGKSRFPSGMTNKSGNDKQKGGAKRMAA
jgi:hypothetical protein